MLKRTTIIYGFPASAETLGVIEDLTKLPLEQKKTTVLYFFPHNQDDSYQWWDEFIYTQKDQFGHICFITDDEFTFDESEFDDWDIIMVFDDINQLSWHAKILQKYIDDHRIEKYITSRPINLRGPLLRRFISEPKPRTVTGD